MIAATVYEWREVWRKGLAPVLPTDGLVLLRDALRDDDPRLVQGSVSDPPPLMCLQDWPCKGGCVIGFCGVVANGGFGDATVGEVEEFFGRTCFDSDNLTGGPADIRWFLNWFDDTPRDEMRRELLPEVEAELARREREAATC